MTDARNYTAQETLKNGLQVTIRAITPDDRDNFLKAFHALDDRSIYLRFFTDNKTFTENEILQAVEIDFVRIVALVTCIKDHDGEKIIGGGRFFVFGDDNPPEKAEVAFMVSNDYHSLGIAGMMLKHLAAIAVKMGIKAFYAEVMAGNTGMLTVFKRSGFPIHLEYEQHVTHVMLEIAPLQTKGI
jgi:RimJ/RimL family protein N-acetyltransferase